MRAFLGVFIGLMIAQQVSAQTAAEVDKNQVRVFEEESTKVAQAIQNYHRNRGFNCSGNPIFVSCIGTGNTTYPHSRGDSFTYNLKAQGDKTEVRLILAGSSVLNFLGMREKITQTTFNQIEKQILQDFASMTPKSADDRSEKAGSILPPMTHADKEDAETRRFNYPLPLIKAGISAYFVNQRQCTQYIENFRCVYKILGIQDRSRPPVEYIIEYREVDGTTTDVRIRAVGTVFERYDQMFASISDHIKNLAGK